MTTVQFHLPPLPPRGLLLQMTIMTVPPLRLLTSLVIMSAWILFTRAAQSLPITPTLSNHLLFHMPAVPLGLTIDRLFPTFTSVRLLSTCLALEARLYSLSCPPTMTGLTPTSDCPPERSRIPISVKKNLRIRLRQSPDATAIVRASRLTFLYYRSLALQLRSERLRCHLHPVSRLLALHLRHQKYHSLP